MTGRSDLGQRLTSMVVLGMSASSPKVAIRDLLRQLSDGPQAEELSLLRPGSPRPSSQSLGISSPAKKACDPRCAGTNPSEAPAGAGSTSLCSASVSAKR